MSHAVPNSARNDRFQFAQPVPDGVTSTGTHTPARTRAQGAGFPTDALLWFAAGSLIIIGLISLIIILSENLNPPPPPDGWVTETPTTGTPDASPTPVGTPIPKEQSSDNEKDALSGHVPTPLVITVVVPYPVIQERVVYVQVAPPVHDYGYIATYSGASQWPGYAGGGSFAYTVQPGDTVYRLARRFGVAPQAIISANSLWDPNYIRIGQVLMIPCGSGY